MPYPAKLTAQKILGAALELLETGGPDALGMRPLADALEVRPSSLYRYYPEREALLTALEAHAAHDLHAALRDAAGGHAPAAALTAAAHAYLEYARAHPHLYSLLLRPKAPYTAEPGPGKELWNEVLALVGAGDGKPGRYCGGGCVFGVLAWVYTFGAERSVRSQWS